MIRRKEKTILKTMTFDISVLLISLSGISRATCVAPFVYRATRIINNAFWWLVVRSR